MPGAPVHRRRVRCRHRARRASDARQGIPHPPRREWSVRRPPEPVRGGALPLARHLPLGAPLRAARHGQRRGRGDHGGPAHAPPGDPAAVSPWVRAHRVRLRPRRPLPARRGGADRGSAEPGGRGRGRERHAPRSPRPRRRSTSGRAGPVIIESVLTTMDARGAINFAPMGVEWGEAEIVIKPFLETTTFKNLEATRVAVINLTDDVMVFAQGAIANVQFPAVPAGLVRGVVLEAACSWREVEVRALDATPPRARRAAGCPQGRGGGGGGGAGCVGGGAGGVVLGGARRGGCWGGALGGDRRGVPAPPAPARAPPRRGAQGRGARRGPGAPVRPP